MSTLTPRDLAHILAPTAGGKTEASMFPAISSLVEDGPEGVGVIYIAPIKALLNNQADRLGLYTELVGLRHFVWHGDVTSHVRKRFLKEPAELLMTTPESLEVMLISQNVDASRLFRDLRIVVVDEIHAIAGSDRGAHLMSVLERIVRLSRHDVQRVGLSATVGNPEAILEWLTGSSARAGIVVDPPKKPGRKQLWVVHRPDLGTRAREAARRAKGGKSLFFCQSRATTEAVAECMRRAGTEVFVHHSAVSKEARLLAEERFHRGSDACIVCTSTLELGIDIGDLDRVLQADAPDTVSSFMQRMGRTGRRAGQAANTTFFCESAEGVVQALALIGLAKAGWVEDVALTDRCWPVLIHQLLAMALADGQLTVDGAWAQLHVLPDFRGIDRREYDRLVRWMVQDGSLLISSSRLVLGPKAERMFGRRNFMALFAVFSSPQSYTVVTTGGTPLGSLNQAFVDRLVDDVSTFLLGGRGWVVLRIQHEDRRIMVAPAPRGRQPTWGGYIPQFLGFELCQKMLEILTSDTPHAVCDPAAAAVLEAHRREMQEVVAPRVGGMAFDGDALRWWTFAGGRINGTLRHALLAVGDGWKVVSDNFLVTVRGKGLTQKAFFEALEQIKDESLWQDDLFWVEVAASLPNYRLSKFQALMPDWVQREVVSTYLLDIEGSRRWLLRGETA